MSAPSLVKDFRTGSDSGDPERLEHINGNLYISYEGDSYSLWLSDGTPGGTNRVQYTPNGGAPETLIISSYNFTQVGDNKWLFTASTETTGLELWSIDSSGNVSLVKDINDGGDSSYPRDFTAINNTLYFEDYYDNYALWSSDGTPEGTSLVQYTPDGGTTYENLTYPSNFTQVGENWLFSASTETTGHELWSINTNGDVSLVKDINDGEDSSYPNNFRVANNTLYFQDNNDNDGYAFWSSDGTSEGTFKVTDSETGATVTSPYDGGDLFEANGNIYFSGEARINGFSTGYELWKIDGDGQASLIQDIRPGSSSSSPKDFYLDGQDLFFTAHDGIHGRELWKLSTNDQTVTTPEPNLGQGGGGGNNGGGGGDDGGGGDSPAPSPTPTTPAPTPPVVVNPPPVIPEPSNSPSPESISEPTTISVPDNQSPPASQRPLQPKPIPTPGADLQTEIEPDPIRLDLRGRGPNQSRKAFNRSRPVITDYEINDLPDLLINYDGRIDASDVFDNFTVKNIGGGERKAERRMRRASRTDVDFIYNKTTDKLFFNANSEEEGFSTKLASETSGRTRRFGGYIAKIEFDADKQAISEEIFTFPEAWNLA